VYLYLFILVINVYLYLFIYYYYYYYYYYYCTGPERSKLYTQWSDLDTWRIQVNSAFGPK